MTYEVTLTAKTGLASAWVRAMALLRYLVGDDRAGDWAIWGAQRFTRFYVNGQRFRP